MSVLYRGDCKILAEFGEWFEAGSFSAVSSGSGPAITDR